MFKEAYSLDRLKFLKDKDIYGTQVIKVLSLINIIIILQTKFGYSIRQINLAIYARVSASYSISERHKIKW